MSDSIKHRVAMAIAKTISGRDQQITPWTLIAAHAAIDAMWEPTDEMLSAGSAAAEVCDDGWESNATWRAMILEALKDESPSPSSGRKQTETVPICRKCGGAGWLWWDELESYDGPAVQSGRDDTRYTCDDASHVSPSPSRGQGA